MDWGLFWQAAGVGVAVVGIVAGGFYWLWGQISKVRDDAEKDIVEVRKEAGLRAEAVLALAATTKEELHQHRLYSAETFVSKAGLREVEDRIMDGLGVLGAQILGMSGRIDRLMERPASSRARSPS